MSEEKNEVSNPSGGENHASVLEECAKEVPQLSKQEVAKIESLIQKIEYVDIDEIRLSPNKARKVRLGVPKVAASIRECGFRSPIYVDGNRNDEIIAGHTRFLAAKVLGLTRVPIVRVTDLTPAKVKLLRLADNRVAEFSAWDFTELNKELEDLKVELPELNFADLGFIDKADLEFDDVDDLDDDNYEEPTENNLCCPKCGYTASKSFFTKKEAKPSKKDDDSDDEAEVVLPVDEAEG